MQFSLTRQKVAPLSGEVFPIGRSVVNRIITDIAHNAAFSVNGYSYATFYSSIITNAILAHIPSRFMMDAKDVADGLEGPDGVVLENTITPTYVDERKFTISEAKQITSLFWPLTAAWYEPLWRVKAHITLFARNIHDVQDAKNNLNKLVYVRAAELLIARLESGIERLLKRIVLRECDYHKCAALKALLPQAKEALQTLPQQLDVLFPPKLPSIAQELWEHIVQEELRLCQMNKLDAAHFAMLYTEALVGPDRGGEFSTLLSLGYSRTQSKILTRMASRASKDVLQKFLREYGSGKDIFPNPAITEKRFRSGAGSYNLI